MLVQAKEYSATYTSRNNLITASVAQNKSDGPNLRPSNAQWATASTCGKKGYFCDRFYHRLADCRQEMLAAFPVEKRDILLASAKQRELNSTRQTQRSK